MSADSPVVPDGFVPADSVPVGRIRVTWLPDYGVYLALGVLLAFNLVFTPNFATVANLRLQLVQVAPVAIVALGMALVIGTEGIDLSVGSTMAIAAALLPLYLGYGPWPAIAVAVLAGAAVGLVNGGLVAYGIQPIVATLGLLVAGRGAALVFADGRLVEIFDPTLAAIGGGQVLGVPLPVLMALTVAAAAGFVLRRAAWEVTGPRRSWPACPYGGRWSPSM